MGSLGKYFEERNRYIGRSGLWTQALVQDLQQSWLLGVHDTDSYNGLRKVLAVIISDDRCWLQESSDFADTWAQAGYEKRRALFGTNIAKRNMRVPSTKLLPSSIARKYSPFLSLIKK